MLDKLDKIPERLEQIHDFNPNPILKVDVSGLIIYANASSKILLNAIKSNVGSHLPEKWANVIKVIYSANVKKEIKTSAGPFIYLVNLIPSPKDCCVYIYGTNITSLIESQKQLSESDSRYKFLAENLRDMITRHDENFINIYVSPVSKIILGYEPLELLGKNLFDNTHPEDISNIRETIKALSTQSDSCLISYRIKNKNGKYIWVETLCRKLIYIKNNIHEIICVTRDISNRKKIEEERIEQEDLHRSVLTSIGEGILIADKDGIVNFVNESIEKISGYSKNEMLGKTVFELFFSASQVKLIRNKLVQEVGNQYEIEALTKDRRKIFVEIRVRPFLNSKGEIKGSISAISDITEKKEISKHIKIQETLLNNILNNLPINIYLKNEEGKLIFINDTAAKTLNKKKKDVLNKDVSLFFPEQTADFIKEDDRQVRLSGAPKVVEEKTLFEKYFLRGKIPFHIDNMGPLLLGYSIDISERKKAEEEAILAKQKAEDSIQSKERFISIMSHEIRTPMNAVVGITNLLLKKEHNQEQKELLKGLKVSSENLLKILNNILDLSKIDSGKLTLESADIDLREILESARESCSYKAAEKNILINIDVDKKIPRYIKGDSFRLDQILLNLLSNAVKFTEEGKIDIAVKMLDSTSEDFRLLFTIADTGIGIPKEKLSEIFESFTQASSEISKKYGGTGLGLTITKKLIEFQNGTIGVESIRNKGAKFIFDLAFGKSNKTEDKKTESELEYNFEGLKALIVEDNEMNQLVIIRFLEQQKILPSVASNGKEALRLLKKNDYDFILMDLQMPELDGYETALNIRNKLMNIKTPIIALTASASDDIENKVLKAGMNDYITKPFEPSTLFSIIATHTDVHRKKQIKAENMENPLNSTDKEKATNLSYLYEASAGNKKFMSEMINIFLEQTPGFINHLKDTSNEKNWLEFRKTMHKIKPTIIMMGIHELENDIPKIENSVKKEVALDKIPSLIAKMESICARAYKELELELKTL
jgi:PAS domain S-box-containing protein